MKVPLFTYLMCKIGQKQYVGQTVDTLAVDGIIIKVMTESI